MVSNDLSLLNLYGDDRLRRHVSMVSNDLSLLNYYTKTVVGGMTVSMVSNDLSLLNPLDILNQLQNQVVERKASSTKIVRLKLAFL